jgi:hypothetical protein
MRYLDHFFAKKLPIPCFHEYYGEFFFNWSIETAKQFMKHLMTMQPTKFYITSTTEIEAVTSKKELFFTIMESYNKLGNKKIDKFELMSVIPFIVGKNFEEVLVLSLKYFCLENEGKEIITKDEFGLFLDCFFRAVHCISNYDTEDNVYQKTKDNLIKLAENELDDLLDQIFIDENGNKIETMELSKLTTNIPEKFLKILKNINEGFHGSMVFYENKIKEENKI